MTKKYDALGGIDTRVLINSKWDEQIQAVSVLRVRKDDTWETKGTIIRLIFDDGFGNLQEDIDLLEVHAANEHGTCALMFALKNVKLMTASTGMAIDDICIEERYDYEATEFIHGKNISKESV